MPNLTARERLIVALDFPSAAQALGHVEQLEGRCLWFKVGLELYLAAGRSIVDTLADQGYKVFLDLKLYDIPNTVAGAVRSLNASGASLLTVHASGGPAMLAAAANAAAQSRQGPRLLAVTVLTSMDEQQLSATGVPASPEQQVLRLARLATSNGISGLVCSPAEVARLHEELVGAHLFVVPGVRPKAAPVGADDQRRVATPGEVIRSGASMLVVGRPITQAAHPAAAADMILKEIAEAL